MIANLPFLYAALHVGLLAYSFRAAERETPRLWLLRVMLLGMFYDNLIVGLGPQMIDAVAYEAANVPRFMLHVGVLPFLTIFTLSIMGAAGIGVAQNRVFRLGCWVFTIICLGYGLP